MIILGAFWRVFWCLIGATGCKTHFLCHTTFCECLRTITQPIIHWIKPKISGNINFGTIFLIVQYEHRFSVAVRLLRYTQLCSSPHRYARGSTNWLNAVIASATQLGSPRNHTPALDSGLPVYARLIGRSHMTIRMTTGMHTGRHTRLRNTVYVFGHAHLHNT